jgi:hypothetical protein
MLFMILQAAQQAKQVAPNVYVMPAPVGMPEWVKIVISAGVGAVFGIGGSVVMEFVKPKLSLATLKRSIATQLAFELRTNWSLVDDLSVLLSTVPTQENHILSKMVIDVTGELQWDRYDFYVSKERGCVYEMDPCNVYGDLLKIPTQMTEAARRYEYDVVHKLIERFKRIAMECRLHWTKNLRTKSRSECLYINKYSPHLPDAGIAERKTGVACAMEVDVTLHLNPGL